MKVDRCYQKFSEQKKCTDWIYLSQMRLILFKTNPFNIVENYLTAGGTLLQ